MIKDKKVLAIIESEEELELIAQQLPLQCIVRKLNLSSYIDKYVVKTSSNTVKDICDNFYCPPIQLFDESLLDIYDCFVVISENYPFILIKDIDTCIEKLLKFTNHVIFLGDTNCRITNSRCLTSDSHELYNAKNTLSFRDLSIIKSSSLFIESMGDDYMRWDLLLQSGQMSYMLKLGMSLHNIVKDKDIDIDIDIYIKDIITYLEESNLLVVRETKEACFLYEYAKKAKGNIVELGTCKAGGSILLGLSDIKNSCRVYSTDVVQLYSNFKRLEQFNLSCNLIESDGAVLSSYWDKPISMLYFDANEDSVDSVYKTIKSWLPHIEEDGYIVTHDYPTDRHLHKKKIRRVTNKDGFIKSPNHRMNVYNAFLKLTRENKVHFVDRAGTMVAFCKGKNNV